MADLAALDEFNGSIKKLVRFTASKSAVIEKTGAVKRIKLLLDEAPLALIQVLGPGLVGYRDKIEICDEKFFLSADFTNDIPEEFEDSVDEIADLIEIIKDVYKMCDKNERGTILADVKVLLSSYDKYRANSYD